MTKGKIGRRIGMAALILTALPVGVYAQDQTSWTGYLEHQYGATVTRGRWTQLDYDRVRVDLKAKAGRDTRLSVAGVAQLFRGDTRTQLRDAVPTALQDAVDSASVQLSDRFFLSHAFLAIRPGLVDVTVGKQYLAWGAAHAFNPTELFRPKDVLDPGYEREGVGAITARLPLGSLSDVLVGFVPDGSIRTSARLARVRHHVRGFDVSAMGAVLYEGVAGFGTAEAPEERRATLGGDVTGELFGLGVWVEATWSDHAGVQWLETTTGGNYTLQDGTLLLVEAYYNGRGEWGDTYSEAAWANRVSDSRRTMGKATVLAGATRPVGAYQLWAVGVSGLVNPGDGSGLLIPSVSYAFAENVQLLANGFVYVGREGSEYGGRRFGGFVRGRVYF